MEIQESTNQNPGSSNTSVTLDGNLISIQELNTLKSQGKHIVESAPGVYKTLQKLNG